MAFTYNSPPTTNLDKLRIAIGDVTTGNGPTPSMGNLYDALLSYFLTASGSVAGAAALAFEHLAALWIPRPIFGPGELSTIHVDMYRKFKQAADDWRARITLEGGLEDDDTPLVGAVTVSTFNFLGSGT